MIAALYSSRTDRTKEFTKGGTRFRWSTVEVVYKSDICRVKVELAGVCLD